MIILVRKIIFLVLNSTKNYPGFKAHGQSHPKSKTALGYQWLHKMNLDRKKPKTPTKQNQKILKCTVITMNE